MRLNIFLHNLLKNTIHKKRITSLILLVKAALKFKQLSVTGLGRAIDLQIQERSCIKRADRLVGNKKLYKEKQVIFTEVIKLLLGNKGRAHIIVDWSGIPNSKYNTLRAALVAKGRALTLYEEVHHLKKLGNERVQNGFLNSLKKLLPPRCNAIIVTDAGFHNNWFKKITSLGWDYIGRIRSNKIYRLIDSNKWKRTNKLCKAYRGARRCMSKIMLSKENAIITHLYVCKEQAKKRQRSNWDLKKGNKGTRNARRTAKESWVLVSSLNGYNACNKVIKIYKKRMQIEESFRDLKSARYGFSFRHSYSRSVLRIEILLLICMLASTVAWLVGLAAERMKLHYIFQVSSTRTRRVLSLFFLGCQVLRRKINIPIKLLKTCITEEVVCAQNS